MQQLICFTHVPDDVILAREGKHVLNEAFYFYILVVHLTILHTFIITSVTCQCPSCQPPPVHTKHPTCPQHRKADSHLDAVLDDVELASANLVPLNGHLGNLDAWAGADNTTITTKDRGGGGRLGEHKHLNVKDPALGMHVWDDVGEGGAREELEAALSIANS